MNELIGSIRRDRMDEFKKKFRNIDLLIVDDVQFIGGKERTQEEFFHTFNSLYESHKQIVITADKFPKEIPGLEDRLRNRFEWGLIADIQPPDMETRVAILQKKAEHVNVLLPHDVAVFLATHIDSNVRELEGSLTRLGAFASMTKSPITLELTKEVLRHMLKGAERDLTVESIQKTICDYYHIKLGDLKAKRRTKNIACRARWPCIYAANIPKLLSLPSAINSAAATTQRSYTPRKPSKRKLKTILTCNQQSQALSGT